jgi:drug/metabolite transporter (DMT)-like permease
MQTLHKRSYVLLGLLILVWGGGWPVLKIGVEYLPPLWFSAGRLAIGTLCVFMVVAFTGHCRLPRRGDVVPIVVISVTQMSAFLGLLNLALSYVDAGRSVILCYTTPLWVLPVASLWFGEKINRWLSLGIILSGLGLMLVCDPWQLSWAQTTTWIGSSLLLLAAISMAIAVLYMRYGCAQRSVIELLPWQLLLATLTSGLVAYSLDPHPVVHWQLATWAILAFTGVLCTAFGYWAVLLITQQLPAVVSALGLLGVPAVGFLSSLLFLNEPLPGTTLFGILLLLAGLIDLVVVDSLQAKPISQQ